MDSSNSEDVDGRRNAGGTVIYETYGEWIRRLPPEKLTRNERAILEAEREWEAANPEEVANLNIFVGQTVYLTQTRKTWGPEVLSWHTVPRGVLYVNPYYAKGMKIHIFARTGKTLLGRTVENTVLTIKPEWITTDVQLRKDFLQHGL